MLLPEVEVQNQAHKLISTIHKTPHLGHHTFSPRGQHQCNWTSRWTTQPPSTLNLYLPGNVPILWSPSLVGASLQRSIAARPASCSSASLFAYICCLESPVTLQVLILPEHRAALPVQDMVLEPPVLLILRRFLE